MDIYADTCTTSKIIYLDVLVVCIVKSQVVDVWALSGQLLNFALLVWKQPLDNM